jgi:hypothetical protein
MRKYLALSFAAAAALILGSFATADVAEARHARSVDSCREFVKPYKQQYKKLTHRLERAEQARNRRVVRIASRALAKAERIMRKQSKYRWRARNSCQFRARKFRKASRQLKKAVKQIRHIRNRRARSERTRYDSLYRRDHRVHSDEARVFVRDHRARR